MSTTTTIETASNIPKSSAMIGSNSKWKDLPYRLCTICIGIPLLWNLWCHDTLRVISFYVIHSLCGYEYIYSITRRRTSSTTSTTIHPHRHSPSPLSNLHGHSFMVISWILLYIPLHYFIPLCLVTLTIVSIITMTQLLWFQSDTEQTPPITTTTITTTTTNQSPTPRTASDMNFYYFNIMIIWFHGILFITIPFRSWIAVSTASTTTPSTFNTGGSNGSMVSGFQPTISLLLTVWNCDTGALLFGRLFGKRYLPPNGSRNDNSTTTTASSWYLQWIPRIRQYLYYISPSKSLEGLMGGIWCGTITYAYLVPLLWYDIPRYFPMIPMGSTTSSSSSSTTFGNNEYCYNTTEATTASSVRNNIGIGLLLSLGAVLGDILESIIKRYHHCKDSGSLLPGHGGIYDRFDSSLISIVLYHYLVLSIGDNNNKCSDIANRGY